MYLINRDGSIPLQLAPEFAGTFNLDSSPDGKHIAFIASASRQSSSNIYTIQPDGTGPVNISNSTYGGVATVTSSPDGNWVVYECQKDSGGLGNIFISSWDGSQQYHLTQSDVNVNYLTPSWKPGN